MDLHQMNPATKRVELLSHMTPTEIFSCIITQNMDKIMTLNCALATILQQTLEKDSSTLIDAVLQND